MWVGLKRVWNTGTYTLTSSQLNLDSNISILSRWIPSFFVWRFYVSWSSNTSSSSNSLPVCFAALTCFLDFKFSIKCATAVGIFKTITYLLQPKTHWDMLYIIWEHRGHRMSFKLPFFLKNRSWPFVTLGVRDHGSWSHFAELGHLSLVLTSSTNNGDFFLSAPHLHYKPLQLCTTLQLNHTASKYHWILHQYLFRILIHAFCILRCASYVLCYWTHSTCTSAHIHLQPLGLINHVAALW